MAMKHFSYASILTDISDKNISNYDIFKKHYEEDCKWLEENDILFQVDVFHWPELPFFTQHQIAKVRREITIIIDNINHAMMFRLYSGLMNY
jgi:hypothetical protein